MAVKTQRERERGCYEVLGFSLRSHARMYTRFNGQFSIFQENLVKTEAEVSK